MTVLVGILCQNGVVVGTDSSATFVAGSMRTVEQPVRKIDVVDGRIIVAGTGQIGLGQRFVEVVARNAKAFETMSAVEAAKVICIEARNDFQSTGAAPEYGALVAFTRKGRLHLVEFGYPTMQPEFKNDGMWYVSMGSGQAIADPFLGLMRRAFCPDGPPPLHTGKFIATWTLAHTCDVNPGGIKEPVVLSTLTNAKDGIKAEILSPEDMAEHSGMVIEAEGYLAGFPEWFAGKSGPPVPDVGS